MSVETLLAFAVVMLLVSQIALTAGVIFVLWKLATGAGVLPALLNSEQNVKSYIDGAVSNLVGFFGNIVGKQTAAIPTNIAPPPPSA